MDDKMKDYPDSKRHQRGTAPNNYKPVMGLSMMWEILATQIREGIYYSLISRRLLPEQLKGCRKGTRSTGDVLYIDQHILKESNMTEKSIYAVDWLRKSIWYIPAKLDNRLFQNVQVTAEVIKFIKNTMEKWTVELTALGKSLTEVKNLERDLPGRCTIFITICNSDGATQSHN